MIDTIAGKGNLCQAIRNAKQKKKNKKKRKKVAGREKTKKVNRRGKENM
jgi:hypothetical protein